MKPFLLLVLLAVLAGGCASSPTTASEGDSCVSATEELGAKAQTSADTASCAKATSKLEPKPKPKFKGRK